MNEPIAKLTLSNVGQGIGTLLSNPLTPASSNPSTSYSSLWGMDNFGMARLLTKEQTIQFTSELKENLPDAPLYMEIKHHPSLYNIKIRQDDRGRMRPMLGTSSSILPLQEADLRRLFDNLYTVRFVVKNGLAYSYGHPKTVLQSPFLPKLPGVPDGTYEFYYGKAYKIHFQGIATELEKSHPIYTFSPERIQIFYNLGLVFDTRFSPQSRYTPYLPHRYVYFRNGSFYALGAPLFDKEDPSLMHFVQKEKEKSSPNYEPFIDKGPPLLADGTLDASFIKQYGLTIPDKMYLGLGDNHAVSADCREFGFVPEDNLRGSPDLIFWPPGSRFGHPNQPPYPFFNLPRSIIWIIAFSSIGAVIYWQRKWRRVPPL
jgi:signal peptidase I